MTKNELIDRAIDKIQAVINNLSDSWGKAQLEDSITMLREGKKYDE